MRTKITLINIVVLLLIIPFAFSFRQGPNVTDIDDPNTYVHQKISKEAENTWNSIPYEIKGRVII